MRITTATNKLYVNDGDFYVNKKKIHTNLIKKNIKNMDKNLYALSANHTWHSGKQSKETEYKTTAIPTFPLQRIAITRCRWNAAQEISNTKYRNYREYTKFTVKLYHYMNILNIKSQNKVLDFFLNILLKEHFQ